MNVFLLQGMDSAHLIVAVIFFCINGMHSFM